MQNSDYFNHFGKIITTVFGVFIAFIFVLYAINPLTNGENAWRIVTFVISAVVYLVSVVFIWLKSRPLFFYFLAAVALIITVITIIVVPFFHGYLMVEVIGFFLGFYISAYLIKFSHLKYRALISLGLEFLVIIMVICFS